MRDLKVPVLMAVFLGVLLIGLGARSLYYEKRVVTPIETAAKHIPGVVEVKLVPAGNGQLKDVVATLDSGVELEKVYQTLDEIGVATLGRSYGRLIIQDRRTPELTQAYYSVHFLVQEGISTGLYASMADRIDEQLSQWPELHHRVFVDDRYVFVQIHDDDVDHYLYEVVVRQPITEVTDSQSRGGRLLW